MATQQQGHPMTPRKPVPPFLTMLPASNLIDRFPPEMTDQAIAQILGCGRAKVRLMRQPHYTIRWFDADRYAIRLGAHPVEIWGWLWTYEVRPVQVHPNIAPV